MGSTSYCANTRPPEHLAGPRSCQSTGSRHGPFRSLAGWPPDSFPELSTDSARFHPNIGAGTRRVSAAGYRFDTAQGQPTPRVIATSGDGVGHPCGLPTTVIRCFRSSNTIHAVLLEFGSAANVFPAKAHIEEVSFHPETNSRLSYRAP